MADEKEKSKITSMLSSSFLGDLLNQIKLVYYLVRDRDVPIYLKVLPFLGVLYVLFPIDIIPDIVPVLEKLPTRSSAMPSLLGHTSALYSGPRLSASVSSQKVK